MQTNSPLQPDFDYSAWYATLSEAEKEDLAFRDLIKEKDLGKAYVYAEELLHMVDKGGSRAVFGIQDLIESDPPPAYAIAFFALMCVDKYQSKKGTDRVNKRHNGEGRTNDIKRKIQDEWLENPTRSQRGKQVAFAEIKAKEYKLEPETVKKYLGRQALKKRLEERLQEGASTG